MKSKTFNSLKKSLIEMRREIFAFLTFVIIISSGIVYYFYLKKIEAAEIASKISQAAALASKIPQATTQKKAFRAIKKLIMDYNPISLTIYFWNGLKSFLSQNSKTKSTV